jgi:hypothetical protein
LNFKLELRRGAPVILSLTKKQFKITGFLIFLISYLAFFNLLHISETSGLPFYAPGTLIFGFLGYWLAGYLYDKYRNN